jgi:glycosyltransferase involved in cell wall biosynthesis
MRILIVEDSKSWAIHKLSSVIDRNNKQLNINIIEIHPKELRNKPEENIAIFEKEVEEFKPDIIHFQYWDIANTLSKSEVCKGKKLILTHHNQKNLLSHNWDNFDKIIVHTQKAKEILEKAHYWNVEVIQHGIDIEKYKYLENYDLENRLLGYCGRIVPWKGLVDILKVAKEIDSEVVMMGKIDKPDYWQKCLEYSDQMDIRFNTPDDEQVNVYHDMAIYVGNSCDNIEEGTLPLLEAMACGIPVVTTPSGEAKDIIKDGENGILVDFENYESLKEGIERMMKADRNKLRENAWMTVKNMSEQVMARKYEKAYYKTLYEKDLVSVIIPTYGRSDTITQVLDGYAMQTYEPIELIVCIDNDRNEDYEEELFKWHMKNEIPIKWIYTFNKGYGLAQARNMGIFEASGHYIVFNDDRFLPDRYAVEAFIKTVSGDKKRNVAFGYKGYDKNAFVENFCCIRKGDIIDAGMFNERITEYGGMSQEIRDRLHNLGFIFHYEKSAKATVLFGTHNKTKKRYEVFRSKLKLFLLRH